MYEKRKSGKKFLFFYKISVFVCFFIMTWCFLLKIIHTFGHSRQTNYDIFTTFKTDYFTEDPFPAYLFPAGGLYKTGIEGIAADDENGRHFRAQAS